MDEDTGTVKQRVILPQGFYDNIIHFYLKEMSFYSINICLYIMYSFTFPSNWAEKDSTQSF